jgi:hypothetical protein
MLVGAAGTATDAGAVLHWRSAIDRRTELFQSFRLRVKIFEMMMMNRCPKALTPDDVMMILDWNYVIVASTRQTYRRRKLLSFDSSQHNRNEKVESFDQCYSTSLKNTSTVFADTFL